MDLKIGDMVMWESHGSGVFKRKEGIILGIVKPNEYAYIYVPPELRKSYARVKGRAYSSIERAAVEVPRESGNGCDYYFPRISMLIKIKNAEVKTCSQYPK